MARGEHPQRTPVYGGGLIVAAMLIGLLISRVAVPTPVRLIVFLVCLVMALVGVLMTFRDLP